MRKILLSIISICALQYSFAQTKEFNNGVFIVNEDWFGRSNGSVNFINSDNTVDYNAYKTINPGEEFGMTTQSGTIYGDKFYFVSKQGNRLVVADAKTLTKEASFTTIGADGRSFLGVDSKTGYIGTSEGIYLFDIKNLQVGALIEGTYKAGQIGNMVRTQNYVFAVSQSGGMLIIDPKSHQIKQTILGSFNSVVQSKDGNVWAALSNKLIKINPATLETLEISIPTKTVPSSWGAWNAGSFCASVKENAIYFFPGSGWSVSPTMVKYDIDNNQFNENFLTIPGQEEQYKQTVYGAGVRVDPVSDELVITTTESGYGAHYEKNWVHRYDNQGNLVKTIQLNDYYWFQALPVFPDTSAPQVNGLEATYHINSETKIDLKDKVFDEDNLSSAILKELTIIENEEVIDISINAEEELVIKPLKNGTATINLSFNSNGKVVEQPITISTAVLGLIDANKSGTNIYPNPVTNTLFIETDKVDKAEIYNLAGLKVAEKILQKGKNNIDVNNLSKGVYIIKTNNTTYKIIKK
ncbi:DUF5074 domain-containing protein [Chishuiella changwenlii]|uniref:DUF5074 domain-containing protein n=1 Tax=Chishuiella changwenlii TaxID=1434701 RepID=UPI002FD984E0